MAQGGPNGRSPILLERRDVVSEKGHFTSNGEDLKIGVHHDHPSQREHSKPMQTSQAVSRGRFGANDLAAVRDRIEGC